MQILCVHAALSSISSRSIPRHDWLLVCVCQVQDSPCLRYLFQGHPAAALFFRSWCAPNSQKRRPGGSWLHRGGRNEVRRFISLLAPWLSETKCRLAFTCAVNLGYSYRALRVVTLSHDWHTRVRPLSYLEKVLHADHTHDSKFWLMAIDYDFLSIDVTCNFILYAPREFSSYLHCQLC